VRLTKKLASVGSVVIVTATFGLVAAPAAHAAVAPMDPTDWTVACDSVTGTIKFATAISLAPSASNNTITVKAIASGCTVPDTHVADGTAPGVNGGGATTGDPYTCVRPGVKHAMTVANGTTTIGTPNISSATSPGVFLASDVGQFVTSSIVGNIPANTFIDSVGTLVDPDGPGGLPPSSTTAVLSQNASTSTVLAKFTLALGTPNQPCVNIAPTKFGGVLTSLAGSNQTRSTSADGNTTSGSCSISSVTGKFTSGDINGTITGAGIPSGTTITAIGALVDGNGADPGGLWYAQTATLGVNTIAQPTLHCATATSSTATFTITKANSSGCLGLSGLSTGTSGNNIAQFKNGSKGLDNLTPLPKLLTAGSGSLNANVTAAIGSTFGNTYVAPWGSYGLFQVGGGGGNGGFTPPNTARTTDAFNGLDQGASDTFEGTTGESSGAILITCLGKGLKAITFGLGHVSFG
jgi:hypothetical protein